ncbi:MAG TPA: aminotransferase class V-fold PLP-dependent enzyme [Gaiellales bacterium]|jgi:aromatic-L-amino-acid decarboxylase
MTQTPLALGDARAETLEHGLALILESWRGFDRARSYQPPIADNIRTLVAQGLSETGIGPHAALDEVSEILDESLAHSRPRFFGYVGSSGLELGVLADALAGSHDINLAASAAAADLVERQTLRWVGDLVGYPAAWGTFTSGGMLSNLTALTAARERALPGSRIEGCDGRGVVYTSAEAHSSVERAVEVLGLGRRSLRTIAIDSSRRMRPDALAEAIDRDVADGRVPVAVVATAGTTLTGAVDPIRPVAGVCAAHNVWLHIDGAYGLPAAATDTARHLFDGLELADSAALDGHKWLFVPKACGVLLVRNRSDLEAAFSHDAPYIPEIEFGEHPVEWTLEYSRPFRALKLWLALRAHGAGAFREAIEHDLELARLVADLVRAADDLELLVEPALSIVPFRRIPAHGDVDEHNRRLVQELQRDGRLYVTGAVVDGRWCLRPCMVNYRTTVADAHALVDIVREVGQRIEQE